MTGRVLPVRHYGSVDVFLEAMGHVVNEKLTNNPAHLNPGEAVEWSNVADKLRELSVINPRGTNTQSSAGTLSK